MQTKSSTPKKGGYSLFHFLAIFALFFFLGIIVSVAYFAQNRNSGSTGLNASKMKEMREDVK